MGFWVILRPACPAGNQKPPEAESSTAEEQMVAAQVRVRRGTNSRVLRSQRTAAAKVTSVMLSGVIGYALPKQPQNHQITMLAMHTSPAQLDQFRTNRLERTEIEFLFAVIAQVRRRCASGLEAVRPHDRRRWASAPPADDRRLRQTDRRRVRSTAIPPNPPEAPD